MNKKIGLGLKLRHTFNMMMVQQRDIRVEAQFKLAFNQEDLKMKNILMKDNYVRKYYLKMHKNRIIKEHTK